MPAPPDGPSPIVVALVHGVSIVDEQFHEGPTEQLAKWFARSFEGRAPDPKAAIVWAPVHWADVFDDRQRKLVEVLVGQTGDGERKLVQLAKQVNRGDKVAMSRLISRFTTRGGSLLRTLGLRPRTHDLNWLALRWLIVFYAGDALGYVDSPSTRQSYSRVHGAFTKALGDVAREHPEAKLAVIAHSLGTVVASDFFYDVGKRVDDLPQSPLERGETLSSFMSLGSPLALWITRSDPEHGMDSPIRVPSAPVAADVADDAEGFGWLNYYDPDDILASPLRGLSREYAAAVRRDLKVKVGGVFGSSPLAHPFYWSDERVVRHMAHQLAHLYASQWPGRYRIRAAPSL